MDLRSPQRRTFRHLTLLALGTAIGSLIAVPAIAQQLPSKDDATSTTPGGIGKPNISSGNGELDVKLNSKNTIIDWTAFNIPEGMEASFTKGGGVIGRAAVLNRDNSNSPSQLLGRLTSTPDVAVWVYNPNGILVGANARISTGSLVLTTVKPNETDFFNDGVTFRLNGDPASQAGITVTNGAQIQVEGGTRGLIMVAPKIDADGQFISNGQDVAFVTATDVTLTYNFGSPLSVTLNRGTTVPGRSQYIKGTVKGNDAIFALASQGTVTDALLQVDANVTTVTAGTRGIVLSAGAPSQEVDGVGVVSSPVDTGGVASLLVNGALETDDGNSDILAGASGNATFAGALSTKRDVSIAVDGALSVTGDVSATRDYLLTGIGVTLGGGASAVQTAGRRVTIKSINGNITGRSGLQLSSGGSNDILLSTQGSTAGDILFEGGTALNAGSNRQGDLILNRRDASNLITLGDVSASGFKQSIGAGSTSDGLDVTGPLVLGDIDVRDPLSITANGITAGTLQSDRSITLASTGAISAAGLNARNGSVALTGTGATTVTGAVSANGNNADVSIARDGAVTLNGISATRDIKIGDGAPAASAAIGGSVTAGRNYLVSAGTVTLGDGTAQTQSAVGTVSITAGAGGIVGKAGLTLTANADGVGSDALTLAIDPAATGAGINFDVTSALIAGPAQQSNVQIRTADSSAPIALGNISANNLLSAVGSDAFASGMVRTGTLTVGDVSLRGDVLLSATSIGAGAVRSSNGKVAIDATAGALTIGGDISAGGSLTLSGNSVSLGGSSAKSGGAIDILARSGGIVSSGALALSSTSNQASDFIRLQAAGADGIVFGAGSKITAGNNHALRVAIFNGTAGAPLTLGDVTARSLGALAALNGDATQPPGAITASGSLAFGNLDLVDSFTAESTAGNLSVAGISVSGVGQGISLRAANGTLTVQNDIATSGDIILASGTALTLGTARSSQGSVSVSSGGDLTLTSLDGAVGVSAQGKTVSIDSVAGGTVAVAATGGDATLGDITGSTVSATATGGSLQVGSVDATGGIALAADKDVTATGNVATNGGGLAVTATGGTASLTSGARASGNVAIIGQTVVLGGTQRAGGAYTAAATAGGITGNAGLTITSDSDATGHEALTLSATGGGIALDAGSALKGGSNGAAAVTLTTNGGGIAIGSVAASTLTLTGATAAGAAISTGDLTLDSDLSLAATNGVTTGAIAVGPGGVAIGGGSGQVKTGSIDGAGAISLKGSGIDSGAITGSSFTATAANGVNVSGDVQSGGAVTIDGGAGDIALAGIDAAGAVSLKGSALHFGAVEAGSFAATATSGVDTTGAIRSDGTVIISGGAGSVSLGDIDAGDAVQLTGGPLQVGSVTGRTLTATSTGGVKAIGDIQIVDAVAIDGGTGDVTLAGLGAGGAVSLKGNALHFGAIQAGSFAATATGGIDTTDDIRSDGMVTVDGGSGDVTLAGIDAGGAIAIKGAALQFGTVKGGAFTATATNGVTATGDLQSTDTVTIDSGTGDTTLHGVDATGAVSLTGNALRFGSVSGGAFSATAVNGDVNGGDITAAGAIEVGAAKGLVDLGKVASTDSDVAITSLGTLSLDSVTAGGGASLSTTGPAADILVEHGVKAVGSVSVASTGNIRAPFIRSSAGDLTISAPNGELSGFDSGSGVSLQAGPGRAFSLTVGTAAHLGDITASQISITATSITAGSVDAGSGTVDLDATQGDLTLTGSITGGAVTLAGSDIQIGGPINASGAMSANARGALTLADVKAGGTMDLASVEALSSGNLDAGGAITLSGNGVTTGSTRSGGGLTLTSRGNATLGDTNAAGGVTVTADGLASFGAVSAGPIFAVTANDVALSGPVHATAVTFINKLSATTATSIGDGTTSGGFSLSNEEIDQITADTLRIDAGPGAMEIGTVNFAPATGGTVEMLSTGAITVTGVVSSTGTGRSFRIGGDTSATGPGATKLYVIATSAAGGRLLLQDADLELRANRIAVGLAPGFIDTLSDGEAGAAQAANLLNDGNSALYNAQLGGGFYEPGATTTIAARSLTLKFGDYALIQNTAVPGEFSGVVLGGMPGSPATPALRVSTTGSPASASFALFGSINGIGGPSAALLGSPVIEINSSLLPNSRINGCLAGSGAGCVTTIVIQPTLQVFSWNSEDVFGISQDVAVPFAPIVGGNNEELLSGLPELAPPAEGIPAK